MVQQNSEVAVGGYGVGIEDIRQAAERISGQVVKTPFKRSQVLSKITGAEVWIKFENFQFTASFKERGALNKLSQLTQAERDAGVCTMSAGNHAQAVAYHASRLGIRSVIVMPQTTPFTKVRNTRELGGEIILHGEHLAHSQEYAERELVAGKGMTLVHPYDDPAVIAGQGTVGLEILEQQPDLDTLVIPVGGGGLISGMALAAHALKPGIEVVGVESVGYASAYAALLGGEVSIKGGQTIAEGIAVKNIGKITLEIIRDQVAELLRVDEPAIERAVGLLASIEKVIAEGAGAVSLAALLADPARFAGRRVGLVISGGNIDTRLLASVLLRQLVHDQRLISLSIDIEDQPGFLARVAGCIGQSGGNIVQVHHERLHRGHAKSTTLEVLVEAQDEAHARQLIEDLTHNGLVVRKGIGMEFE